jgi:hypothetical protein
MEAAVCRLHVRLQVQVKGGTHRETREMDNRHHCAVNH